MIIYIVVVMAMVAAGIYVTINIDPLTIDKNLTYTINSQITNNVLDYSIDKFFFETDGGGLKPGWYSLGYYVDSNKKEKNDTILLKFLGNGKMDQTIFQQLGEYHEDLGGFSRFVDGEDDGYSFAILVSTVSFDGTSDGYGDDTVNGFKVEVGTVKEKGGKYNFESKYTYYK